jgi:hypothetical protein
VFYFRICFILLLHNPISLTLMTVVFHQVGTLNLELLEAKVQKPLSPADHKITEIKFKTKGIKYPNLVYFHQKFIEMLYH